MALDYCLQKFRSGERSLTKTPNLKGVSGSFASMPGNGGAKVLGFPVCTLYQSIWHVLDGAF